MKDLLALRADIVRFAMDKFYILFSRYHDISKISGSNLLLVDVVMAMNHTGLFLVDQQDALKLQIEYPDIVHVNKTRYVKLKNGILGSKLKLKCLHYVFFIETIKMTFYCSSS